MMKIGKIGLALILLLTLGCLYSCTGEQDESLMENRCNISDFELKVLDNGRMFPEETNGEPVHKEALVLGIAFQKAEEQMITKRLASSESYILEDVIIAIDVQIRQLGTEISADMTSSFRVRGSDIDNLKYFNLNVFPPKDLLLVLLDAPDKGRYEFVVSIEFDSGRVLNKKTSVELI